MRYVLCVLAFFYCLSRLLYAIAEPVAQTELDTLFIQHIMFLSIDAITLAFLWRCPDTTINIVIKILICLSIINHAFGAYNYWSYNESVLAIYDQAKMYIFYSEILALLIYGSGQAIRRKLRGANSAGLRKLSFILRREDNSFPVESFNPHSLGPQR